jgi:hypothetical protein
MGPTPLRTARGRAFGGPGVRTGKEPPAALSLCKIYRAGPALD